MEAGDNHVGVEVVNGSLGTIMLACIIYSSQ